MDIDSNLEKKRERDYLIEKIEEYRDPKRVKREFDLSHLYNFKCISTPYMDPRNWNQKTYLPAHPLPREKWNWDPDEHKDDFKDWKPSKPHTHSWWTPQANDTRYTRDRFDSVYGVTIHLPKPVDPDPPVPMDVSYLDTTINPRFPTDEVRKFLVPVVIPDYYYRNYPLEKIKEMFGELPDISLNDNSWHYSLDYDSRYQRDLRAWEVMKANRKN